MQQRGQHNLTSLVKEDSAHDDSTTELVKFRRTEKTGLIYNCEEAEEKETRIPVHARGTRSEHILSWTYTQSLYTPVLFIMSWTFRPVLTSALRSMWIEPIACARPIACIYPVVGGPGEGLHLAYTFWEIERGRRECFLTSRGNYSWCRSSAAGDLARLGCVCLLRVNKDSDDCLLARTTTFTPLDEYEYLKGWIILQSSAIRTMRKTLLCLHDNTIPLPQSGARRWTHLRSYEKKKKNYSTGRFRFQLTHIHLFHVPQIISATAPSKSEPRFSR